MPCFDEPFIFVSYAREDLNIVRPQVTQIKGQGYKTWLDIDELEAGTLWDDAIRQAISACSCFLVFVTSTAVQSKHVAEEIDAALKAGKPFICVYRHKVKFPFSFQDNIDKIQALEQYCLSTSEYEEGLNRALSKYIHPKKIKPGAASGSPGIDIKPVSPATAMPAAISPKVICFILNLLAVFFALLAIVAMATPFFGTQEPNDPLNNRLAGFLAGALFIFIAAGLGATAFIVKRKYLQEEK